MSEDIEIINCSTLSTSGWGPGSCEYYYPDCYNYLDYGGSDGSWSTECGGGTAEIDNSFCQEIEMPECSEMNELECSNEVCENVVCCDEGVVAVTCYYCCATFGVNVEEDDSCC